ncbi:hypothetical protein [uncultured Cohaesibacter sp.]|uniref:PepSY domain-containing protein n=1 Tax=uncultured Cohaesibacter sp. TaxID=1002546 RepID=UPI00292F3FAD|nr:hypothetical protein [uncultured Cohaesibacter sp.]
MLLLSLLLPVNQANAAGCLGAQETRQAIADGKAQRLSKITKAANKHVRGDVIKANLCVDGGRLVYQLVVLSRQGTVSRLVLDAKSMTLVAMN